MCAVAINMCVYMVHQPKDFRCNVSLSMSPNKPSAVPLYHQWKQSSHSQNNNI